MTTVVLVAVALGVGMFVQGKRVEAQAKNRIFEIINVESMFVNPTDFSALK